MGSKSRSDMEEEEEVRLLREELEVEEDELPLLQAHQKRRWSCCSKTTCYYIALFFAVVLALIAVNSSSRPAFTISPDGSSPPWYPSPLGGSSQKWAESYQKARQLVNQMTFVEKVNVTTGIGWMMGLCVGNTGPVPRLNFPSLCLQDGPLGLRFTENITAFPAGITVGATWDRDLFFRRGQALGAEALAKGVNVILGPALGPIGRSPLGGRNWEGFGTDPVLQGVAAAHTIQGIQSQGVIATAKHFIGNEQEHFRIGGEWQSPESISVTIDDRTLHEIYAWPFQDSVRAGVGAVMCSYNQVNNSYACQNSKLMNGVLKDELGFQGFVVSDWLAQHAGVASTLAGLDMTMPGDGFMFSDGNSFWGARLTQSVLNGSVPIERLNDMALRIVAAWYQLGQDTNEALASGPNFSSWTDDKMGRAHHGSDDYSLVQVNKFVDASSKGKESHVALARKIAADSIVLLKNEGNFLPLQAGEESAPKVKIGLFGSAAFDDPSGPNSCEDRACLGRALGSGWGSGAVNFRYLVSPFTGLSEAFGKKDVELTAFNSNDPSTYDTEQVHVQHICLVVLTSNAGEGYLSAQDTDGVVRGDRNHLFAQYGGETLIKYIISHCHGDVVVVIQSVGPVIVESFIDDSKVKAVLMANLPGQESGHALADVLLGDVNPGGRLPYTIAKSLQDYGDAAKILETLSRENPLPKQIFSEGLFIDYRHFDLHGIEPRFEFGFGLSYTEFSLLHVEATFRKEKTPYPDPPPAPIRAEKPSAEMEDPSASWFPDGFRALKKYVYPYIFKTENVLLVQEEKGIANDPSPAGGDQGGNPSLHETHMSIFATVANNGSRTGSCVLQAYVNWPKDYYDPDTGEHVEFPVRTLRGFSKLQIAGNNGVNSTEIQLTRRDLSYWSTHRQNWVMPMVPIKVEIGFSSRNILDSAVY